MSVGNLKDQGGKGTNHPYQLKTLRALGILAEYSQDISTGSYTPDVIAASSLTFPYSFPSGTYKAFSIVVPSGETIEFNGVTLIAGVYNFSGVGNQTSNSFTLDNPSGTGVYILTTL